MSYDAFNRRVVTSTNGTILAYGFNSAGQRATVWDVNGNLLSAQYYVGSQPLAYWLAADGHVRFQHQDWVGTERLRTSYNGSVEGSYISLPFGDGLTTASGSDTDAYHYAGQDSDTVDLQHATYREFSSMQGRWLRPDPDDGSYDLGNPQSLNRYSYAGNSPTVFADPSGLKLPVPPNRSVDGDGPGWIRGGNIFSGMNLQENEFDILSASSYTYYGWFYKDHTGDVGINGVPLQSGWIPDDPITLYTGLDLLNLFQPPASPVLLAQNTPPNAPNSGQQHNNSKSPVQQKKNGSSNFSPKACFYLDWGMGYLGGLGVATAVQPEAAVVSLPLGVISVAGWGIGKIGGC